MKKAQMITLKMMTISVISTTNMRKLPERVAFLLTYNHNRLQFRNTNIIVNQKREDMEKNKSVLFTGSTLPIESIATGYQRVLNAFKAAGFTVPLSHLAWHKKAWDNNIRKAVL